MAAEALALASVDGSVQRMIVLRGLAGNIGVPEEGLILSEWNRIVNRLRVQSQRKRRPKRTVDSGDGGSPGVPAVPPA